MHTTCAFSRKSCSARQTRILSKVMKTRMRNVPKAETCYLGMEGNSHGKWEAVCRVYFYYVKRVSGVNGIVCMHPSPKSAATDLPRAELGILHWEACTKNWYESNLGLLQAICGQLYSEEAANCIVCAYKPCLLP
jgi:hypothetical protein